MSTRVRPPERVPTSGSRLSDQTRDHEKPGAARFGSKSRPALGLTALISVVLAAALLVEFAGNSLINAWQDRRLVSEAQTVRLAAALVAADKMAVEADPVRRGALVAALAGPPVALNWVSSTVITDATATHGRLGDLRAALVRAEPSLAGADLRLALLHSDSGDSRDLLGALKLSDGSFVSFRLRPFLNAPPGFLATLAVHVALLLVVFGVALLVVRAIVRPLRNLALAADATGRGAAAPIPPEGPIEVRRVAVAFEAMQQRLRRMVDDHTQALVAVSHDLRTPVQRLGLRAALLEDEPTREAMARDLADIERFLGSVLSFVRSGEEEAARRIDLAAIAMTAADNASDAGADIDYLGPDALPADLPPLAVKRALANLIDNALAHAAKVRITLAEADGDIVLSVEDDGPGIPPDRREDMLLPFRRMEGQRPGGAGLGLSIVKGIAEGLGGRLTLEDSPMGGLAARLRLPAQSSPTRAV